MDTFSPQISLRNPFTHPEHIRHLLEQRMLEETIKKTRSLIKDIHDLKIRIKDNKILLSELPKSILIAKSRIMMIFDRPSFTDSAMDRSEIGFSEQGEAVMMH